MRYYVQQVFTVRQGALRSAKHWAITVGGRDGHIVKVLDTLPEAVTEAHYLAAVAAGREAYAEQQAVEAVQSAAGRQR